MGRRHTRTSSHVVLNNNDLLTLILLRVPWRKLVSLKCVSRQWLSLITAPHFISLRNLFHLRASGLFLQYRKVYFVDLDDPNTPSPFRALNFAHDPYDTKRIGVVQSCKGLLLCCTAHSVRVSLDERNHYVYNPSTNQLDTLPKHPCHNRSVRPCINLIFDPSKSLHYKVIAFLTRPNSRAGDFYIYSSITETWRVSLESYLPSRDEWFGDDGVYWNGRVHWLRRYSEAPFVSDSLCFNVDEERLETFPSTPTSKWLCLQSYFGESEDHLHYTEVCPYASSFSIYEMKSDYSEWFVKYQIDIDPISKIFPEMKRKNFHNESYHEVSVLSLLRKEDFQEDSFLVLEIPGKIIRYNLIDGSIKVIWDFVVDLKVHVSSWSCGDFKGWPYIERGPA